MEPHQIIAWIVFVGLIGFALGWIFGSNWKHDFTQFLLRRNRELAEENERLKADDWQVFDVED